uniref:NADH-ubiquinone oxidoreductase chain 2 n=1 Tax=Prionospio sp. 4 MH-2023 TaxID=3059272 RepID=A0AAU6QGH5_9ANNE
MMLYPFLQLFLSTLFISTVIAISSHHWVVIWLALELNMISFIPLIASSNWHQEHEAGLKYLIFQALGSSLLLLFSFNLAATGLLIIALTIKLGAAPFHFWFPSVMKSSSWSAAAILMTWQKIAPVSLMLSFFSQAPLLSLVGMLSAGVGGVGGMNQTHIRSLLAYSSIGHMGWIIAGAAFSPSAAIIYFFVYVLMSLAVVGTSLLSNVSLIKSTFSPKSNAHHKLLIPAMISLGGLPPFTGFIPKLLLLMSMNTLFIPLLLIASSLLNLIYYLNFIFTAFLSTNQLKAPAHINYPFFMSASLWLATSPLPMVFMLTLLI